MSSERYEDRKRRELDLLCAATGMSVPDAPITPYLVQQTKQRCKLAMRQRVLVEAASITETNRSGDPAFSVGLHPLWSCYQRFDLKTTYRDTLDGIYRVACPPGAVSTGSHTSCGMAAITGVAMALHRLGAPITLQARPGIYFETLSLFRTSFPAFSVTATRSGPTDRALRVRWIDFVDPHPLADGTPVTRCDTDILVIDTTCRTLQDRELHTLVAQSLARGVPCVLVRSHLKLDSLALEYGRLGSTVFLCSTAVDRDLARTFGTLIAHYRDAVARMGLNFDPLNLFPLHHDPAFHRLNELRISVIRHNTRVLAEAAEAHGLAIDRFEHELFITVRLAEAMPEHLPKPLAAALLDSGIPSRPAGSFGFDFVAVDGYRDAAGVRRLRLSPADLDPALMPVLASGVARFLAGEPAAAERAA